MADQEPQSQNRLNALDDRRKSVRLTPMHHSYTKLVKKLRWGLPFVALAIVAVLMIWPKIEVEFAQRRFEPSKLDRAALEAAATENRLLNANFSSVDSKGRPFSLTSDEALQEQGNPDGILLKNPHGKVRLDDDDKATADAKHGLYAQAKQNLTLNDDVVLTRSDGTVMHTQTLFIDLMNNNAHTDVPVDINGPQGHLTAQGMDVREGGLVTVFQGPAKLILNTHDSISPVAGPTKGGS